MVNSLKGVTQEGFHLPLSAYINNNSSKHAKHSTIFQSMLNILHALNTFVRIYKQILLRAINISYKFGYKF